MFDALGGQIAAFDDCRFRRTYLRRHTTLDSVAFHYETVPSTIFGREPMSNLALPDASALHGLNGNHSLNSATLLLDAAIYRACHEIALAIAGRDGAVSLSNLPDDPEFRPFLVNCLYILEDAGIASAVDGEWHVPLDFTLPPVSDVLQELYREDAGRVAEAVLVNNAYRETLEAPGCRPQTRSGPTTRRGGYSYGGRGDAGARARSLSFEQQAAFVDC